MQDQPANSSLALATSSGGSAIGLPQSDSTFRLDIDTQGPSVLSVFDWIPSDGPNLELDITFELRADVLVYRLFSLSPFEDAGSSHHPRARPGLLPAISLCSPMTDDPELACYLRVTIHCAATKLVDESLNATPVKPTKVEVAETPVADHSEGSAVPCMKYRPPLATLYEEYEPVLSTPFTIFVQDDLEGKTRNEAHVKTYKPSLPTILEVIEPEEQDQVASVPPKSSAKFEQDELEGKSGHEAHVKAYRPSLPTILEEIRQEEQDQVASVLDPKAISADSRWLYTIHEEDEQYEHSDAEDPSTGRDLAIPVPNDFDQPPDICQPVRCSQDPDIWLGSPAVDNPDLWSTWEIPASVSRTSYSPLDEDFDLEIPLSPFASVDDDSSTQLQPSIWLDHPAADDPVLWANWEYRAKSEPEMTLTSVQPGDVAESAVDAGATVPIALDVWLSHPAADDPDVVALWEGRLPVRDCFHSCESAEYPASPAPIVEDSLLADSGHDIVGDELPENDDGFIDGSVSTEFVADVALADSVDAILGGRKLTGAEKDVEPYKQAVTSFGTSVGESGQLELIQKASHSQLETSDEELSPSFRGDSPVCQPVSCLGHPVVINPPLEATWDISTWADPDRVIPEIGQRESFAVDATRTGPMVPDVWLCQPAVDNPDLLALWEGRSPVRGYLDSCEPLDAFASASPVHMDEVNQNAGLSTGICHSEIGTGPPPNDGCSIAQLLTSGYEAEEDQGVVLASTDVHLHTDYLQPAGIWLDAPAVEDETILALWEGRTTVGPHFDGITLSEVSEPVPTSPASSVSTFIVDDVFAPLAGPATANSHLMSLLQALQESQLRLQNEVHLTTLLQRLQESACQQLSPRDGSDDESFVLHSSSWMSMSSSNSFQRVPLGVIGNNASSSKNNRANSEQNQGSSSPCRRSKRKKSKRRRSVKSAKISKTS